ncbi:hypothetical protein ABW286_22850 [Erwinia papayae]|uniref:Uncharacterized protein n=1 Tax=Erwinia papayae TaxID=206499 RepID=A0ABV3N821_9GAMM
MNLEMSDAFPVASAYTEEEMQQRFWKCLYTSAPEEMLNYWVVLSQSLKPAEINAVDFPAVSLTNIGRYLTTDNSPYLEVWVGYEHCQWEMNASDWLFKKLALMGERVLQRRFTGKPSGNGIFADVLTVRKHESGDEVISRYTVQKDYNPQQGGGNYFLLKASCASHDYAALLNDIYITAVNWDLSHRSNLAMAELLSTVDLNKHGTLKIPASWKARALAVNRLVIEHTIENINYGVINLYFYPMADFPSAGHVYDKASERFHQPENGLTLAANEIEPLPNEINEASGAVFETCSGEIYSEKEKMRAFYQMYIFNQSGMWCYAELVGRQRNAQDYHFEINKRCMEIILSTISIGKE